MIQNTMRYEQQRSGQQSYIATYANMDVGVREDQQTKHYFEYVQVLERIIRLLSERYSCDIRLYYQEGMNDVWNDLAEDIKEGDSEIEHISSVFDLVESRQFSYRPSSDQTNVDIGPSVRNNVFGYPRYKVAFARIPILVQHGISWEDLVFAESDEGLRRMLEDRQQRQLRQRKVAIFTDTRDGLERNREPITHSVTRSDVIMDDAVKLQIFRSIDEFFSQDRSFFQTYNVPYKRGILLYGSPGNGKTTLVKSIVGSIHAPVSYWQITEYTNSESIQEVFAAAMRMAPTVLVIEDIDSMPESCRSFFLNTLDGATSKEGIFLIGTTNYPEKIDPALMNRAGRFDRAYEVKKPDESLRFAYLMHKGLSRFATDPIVALAARNTEGFSLAQLNELYVSAALQMHYDNELDVDRLITELKADLTKDRKGTWLSDVGSNVRVGFVAK